LDIKPAKLIARTLTAHLYGIVAQAGNSLLEDAPTFGTGLSDALGTAIGYGLDGTFFNGDGVGKPLGMLNDSATLTVSKETGQLAATVVYENLANMFARMHPSCHRNAVWVASSTTIPQLLGLQLGLGVAGVHFPVLQQDSGRFFIFGKEVLFSDQLPALGSKGDISLVDWSQYTVGLRKEITVDVSAHVGFLKNLQTYRAVTRVDGGGRWSQAFTPKAGSTLSWAVTLAARA
jgi:HK97 family phage major capsid protein